MYGAWYGYEYESFLNLNQPIIAIIIHVIEIVELEKLPLAVWWKRNLSIRWSKSNGGNALFI